MICAATVAPLPRGVPPLCVRAFMPVVLDCFGNVPGDCQPSRDKYEVAAVYRFGVLRFAGQGCCAGDDVTFFAGSVTARVAACSDPLEWPGLSAEHVYLVRAGGFFNENAVQGKGSLLPPRHGGVSCGG